MSEVLVRVGSVQAVIQQLSASQLSTSSYVVIDGTEFDSAAHKLISVTATRATHDVDVGIYGANISSYADEVLIDTLQPTASTPDSYTSFAGYRFYRLKIKDTVGGSHGTGTVTFIAKSGSASATDFVPEGSTNLYFTDARALAASLNNIPTSKVSLAVDQSIGDDIFTAVEFDTNDLDVGSVHETVTHPSRFTAPRDGVYMFWHQIAMDASNAGIRAVAVQKNGTTTLYYQNLTAALSNTVKQIMTGTVTIQLAAGDYVEVLVYQNSSGALAVKGGVIGGALTGNLTQAGMILLSSGL